MTLNRAKQVLSIQLREEDRILYPSLPLAKAFWEQSKKKLPFVSLALLAAKAKQFDDGLYAAVEMALHKKRWRGYRGKNHFLLALLRRLLRKPHSPAKREAAAWLAASIQLAGLRPKLPQSVASRARLLQARFLKKPLRSRPLSFYTWKRPLRQIFQRDRMLQSKLSLPVARALMTALSQRKRLRRRYMAELAFVRQLTNPYSWADLRFARTLSNKPPRCSISVFPPCQSHEINLIKRLYGNRPIPPGVKLSEMMIERVRAGRLSLRPTVESGWYDYQSYALEPLLIPNKMPEGKYVFFQKSYREVLEKLFLSLLALTRETHGKGLEGGRFGAGGVSNAIHLSLTPQLQQAPLASYYLRRALSYLFLRKVLQKNLGLRGLKKLRRLRARGRARLSLYRELRQMEALFYGAYLCSAEELFMPPQKIRGLGLPGGSGRQKAFFRRWAKRLKQDQDLARDLRMMLPLFYDQKRRKTKVWVVLGLYVNQLKIEFKTPPEIMAIRDSRGKKMERANFEFHYNTLTVPQLHLVGAEAYVSKILNRKEFRQHCNRYKTQYKILQHLK